MSFSYASIVKNNKKTPTEKTSSSHTSTSKTSSQVVTITNSSSSSNSNPKFSSNTSSNTSSNPKFSSGKIDPNICYIVVLDFEATCWDDNNQSRHRMEIIEFPSVLVEWNFKTGKTRRLGEFQEYCKPQTSKISKFCYELTGISQKTVDKADSFPNVFKRHFKWLQSLIPNYSQQPYVNIMTVGDWDIAKQLPKDLKRWGLKKQKIATVYKSFYNIKSEFVYHLQPKNKRGFGMANMLKYLKLSLDGRHHSGIDDCRNTAKILERLVQLGLKADKMQLRWMR